MKCRILHILLVFFVALFSLQGQQEDFKLSLEHIYTDRLFASNPTPDIYFSPSGDYIYERVEDEGIYKVAIEDTGNRQLIVDAKLVMVQLGDSIPFSKFVMSKSGKKCFLFQDISYVYRRSYKSKVYVYHIDEKRLSMLDIDKIFYPTFSPDEEKAAYIKDRNLWVYYFKEGHSEQLSRGGSESGIINGMSDWVYEEEFELTRAYEWSVDSKWITYLRFDENKVREKVLQYYLTETAYPSLYRYKYPKSGEANSVPSLHMVSLEDHSHQTKSIFLHEQRITETDVYIPRLYVTPSNEIAVMRMNRLQNAMDILLYQNGATEPRTIYHEEDARYIDLSSFFLTFLKNGHQFVISSEQEGYNQLYLYDIQKGKRTKLTQDSYDIDHVVGHNEERNIFYYQAAYPSPIDRTIFQTNLRGAAKKISSMKGWNNATFSPSASYYVHEYSDLSTPTTYTLRNIKNSQFERVIQDDKLVAAMADKFGRKLPELTQFLNRHGDLLNVRIFSPPNMDSSKLYPVLFSNYGGPGSQQVRNRYATDMWSQWMAQSGYIIVTCDNRGTGYRGADFKKQTYRQLGIKEIEDQVDVARLLAKKSYVDEKRIGHIGWSYGGFMSCLAITYGAEVFSSAVAIAPVTHWRFYDNIYTERFMRTPEQNMEGYSKTSPMSYLDKMEGKLLIIHGQTDDNVHPQNTYHMVEAMVQQNKRFDMRIYPDKNHSIYGGNTRLDLWRYVSEWLLKNL